ncbi:MAG: DUF1415 domain-containing protein [Saprospiraceae bacterium]|nr:DUF1415 domain-containing protein [Saprospiraceae bacterium]
MQQTDQEHINRTLDWIHRVIIGCNFCPFAARPLQRNGIRFRVDRNSDLETMLATLAEEFQHLDQNPDTETTLLILQQGLSEFEDYLDFLSVCQQLLEDLEYEGIYQLASFHPAYQFAGTDLDDPSNYTNRSPYPIIHILREDSLEKALASYPNPELIPERNIRYARERGLEYMKALLS